MLYTSLFFAQKEPNEEHDWFHGTFIIFILEEVHLSVLDWGSMYAETYGVVRFWDQNGERALDVILLGACLK